MWNLSFRERSLFALYFSRNTLAQILRAALNFAISSKKSKCELKKKESLGAKSSTSKPAFTA